MLANLSLPFRWDSRLEKTRYLGKGTYCRQETFYVVKDQGEADRNDGHLLEALLREG